MSYQKLAGLQVHTAIATLVANEIAPGTGVDPERFWAAYAEILSELGPENAALLAKRDALQAQIDAWHLARRGQAHDAVAYRAFLEEIGYLVPAGEDFVVTTTNVDPEVATMAGPQLVVPVMNARFALNAANARWGSYYDALYGTDAIARSGELAPGQGYNPERGAAVIAQAASLLDATVPLASGSHVDASAYGVTDGAFGATIDGAFTPLADGNQYRGMRREGEKTLYLLVHNGLHIELVIDFDHAIGKTQASGLCDVVLEAALTTIQDCEDSIAAVDAEDKAAVYSNWLHLMKGDLEESFVKAGQSMTRRLEQDRVYTDRDGRAFSLPGRSLMLVRHVGHLMTSDAVLDAEGRETPEGIMDAMITSLAALHDLQKSEGLRNSRAGSIYAVKPKMHGPEEVAFANKLFDRVEDALGLARNTLKIGVMDEERRTSVNLKEAIRAVKDRVVFINTGFLDRTGDEIHTSMQAGAVVPKDEIKSSVWLNAYEASNVETGLATGLDGKAQIGKGMWAKPDAMAEMIAVKGKQLSAGASTAWVPSPTAAVLHAVHYHEIDVRAAQGAVRQAMRDRLDGILTPPFLGARALDNASVQRELDNNCQGILGYVVRWIDQGIGCSKVPDINDVGLMEDRATLRISSQHVANWLLHGLVTAEAVDESLQRMAEAVDRQNAGDPNYVPMMPNYQSSIAFETARALIFEGLTQPNGYTEPLLHAGRKRRKAELKSA